MLDYLSSLIFPDATLRDAVVRIEESECKIAIAVDADHKLIGTITDGDVRRALINGYSFDDSIDGIIFKTPTTAHIREKDSKIFLLEIMERSQVRQIPLLDDLGRVVGIEVDEHLRQKAKKENLIVIMAGGEGKRLRPLTEETPKPMLKLGVRPMMETTIQNFIAEGFCDFLISVNYKAHIIIDHFKDGSDLGVKIRYLEEEKFLDTAGALTLFPEVPTMPFIVINGDILTKVDFGNVLNFHEAQGAMATMCVREHNIQIPYGVVNSDNFVFQSVEEKPVFTYFINAGIYAFNPEVLKFIKPDTPLTMPDLFQTLKEAGQVCSTYPIHEYWLDIGRIEDYNNAVNVFSSIFK